MEQLTTSAITFPTHTHFLKQQILELAGWLAPGESMTAGDATSEVRWLVDSIAANPSTTPVQMALIAHALAQFIDRPQP